jgi:hypothetical protein
MYTDRNFRTKKALKEAVAAGQLVGVYQANGDLTGFAGKTDGEVGLEGPHYPEPHRWYATAIVRGGVVVSVK